MSADLTPAGSAAVRLADALVRTKKQRDKARDWAAVLEEQLARLADLPRQLEACMGRDSDYDDGICDAVDVVKAALAEVNE